MNFTFLGLNIGALLVMSTVSVSAGDVIVPVVTPGGASETELFAGLNWTFGPNSSGLTGRLGAAYSDIDSSANVSGGRAFVEFSMSGQPTSFVLTGFNGDTDLVGELGVGYGLDGRFFALGGLLGDHWELGGTYSLGGGGLDGYVGLNTLDFEEVEAAPVMVFAPL